MEFVKFFWLFGVFFSIEHTVRKKKITFIQNFVEKVDGIVNVKGECLPLLTVTISRIV